MVYELGLFSFLQSLVSSFLASWLTYYYTDRAWRRRRHLDDIKKVCLNEILSRIIYFEMWFSLEEDKVSRWVRSGLEPLPTTWCEHFSFGFEDPPTSDYTMLLHDLGNHFPELVKLLREFEENIRTLCPRYSIVLRRLVAHIYDRAREITSDAEVQAVLTEAVVMKLAGYDELAWPNDRNLLEKHGLLEILEELLAIKDTEHAREFLETRKKIKALLEKTKRELLKALYTNKLPGKCDIY